MIQSRRPRAMFVGRWQPLHKGHEWLFNQKLEQGIPLLICVRDLPPDEQNPLYAYQVAELLRKRYAHHDVVVMVIPDIESVCYGRGVGYAIQEYVPPADIGHISATEIRRRIRAGDESWRGLVDVSIQSLLKDWLT